MNPFRTRFDIDRLDNRDPRLIHRLARLCKPVLWRYFRPQVRGLERIPEGPGLFVGNHSGALTMPDVFVFGAALYERGGLEALPYGLGHATGISLPLLDELFVPIGAVRASRENASRLFRAGHKVLVYPGGELDSMRSWWDRERVIFGPRRGYIRLALTDGVPIIPVVSAGSHETLIILNDGQTLARLLGIDRLLRVKAWPVVLCLPWGLWIGIPPPHFPLPSRIFIEVLDPIDFDRHGEEAAADPAYVEACHLRVHDAMQAALSRLSAERRRRPRA